MVDRLRALLDQPLDPRAGGAVLVLASAILLGLAALFVLAARETQAPVTAPSASAVPAAGDVERERTAGSRPSLRRQDPQDEEGSTAGRRAARALRSHRALQHVPYRSGEVTVVLGGARGDRAILRVSAPTARVARRGWHRFLRRYRDSGRAYLPLFKGRNGTPDG